MMDRAVQHAMANHGPCTAQLTTANIQHQLQALTILMPFVTINYILLQVYKGEQAASVRSEVHPVQCIRWQGARCPLEPEQRHDFVRECAPVN